MDIGYWWTICCHRDLEQISNQADLDSVRSLAQNFIDEDEPPEVEVWPSHREALLDIRKRFRDSATIAEIDEMLSKIPL